MPLLAIALRATVTYVYLLVLLRLTGKRTIKEGTPFDLVVALVIGDMPDDVIWGDVPLAQGLVAMGTVALLHVVVERVTYRSMRLDRLANASATVIARDGGVDRAALVRAHMNEDDLTSTVRTQGLEDPALLRAARVERSGEVTIVRGDAVAPVTGSDRERVRALAR
jgi:uncharacterized membrane protein YcaP (DUF421 family)